jgi:hypothetical protein
VDEERVAEDEVEQLRVERGELARPAGRGLRVGMGAGPGGAEPGEGLARREPLGGPGAEIEEGLELLGGGELGEDRCVAEADLADGEVELVRRQRAHERRGVARPEDHVDPLLAAGRGEVRARPSELRRRERPVFPCHPDLSLS